MSRYTFCLVTALLLNLPAFGQYSAYGQMLETGQAIYYADYLHGKTTALGEVYQMDELTAAHKTQPLGTLLKVTRLDNNRSVVVRVNDRGPYCEGCIIDLSYAAAEQIDMIKNGRARVRLEPVGFSNTNPVNPEKGKTKYQALKSPSDFYYSDPGPATPQSYADGRELRARGTTQSNPNTQVDNPNEINYLAPDARGYIIQVGSYSDISNASRHVIQLQKKGLEGVYIKEDRARSGGILNRVVIGAFTDYGKAQEYLDGLKAGFYTDGVIMRLK